MATIGILDVLIRANNKDFSKKLKESGDLAKHFQISMKGIGTAATAMGAALVGAGAVLGKWSNDAMNLADDLGTLSTQLGLSVENLSELRFVAELSDTSFETLARSISKMMINVEEMARTGKDDPLKALGLSADNLRNLSPQEAFEAIAQAISELESPFARAAAAQKIFGKSGTEILGVLTKGKEGIAGLRKEAHELGITLSDLDAAELNRVKDEIAKIGFQWEAFKTQVGGVLAPALLELGNIFNGSRQDAGQWGEEVGNIIVDVTAGFLNLGDVIKRVVWAAIQDVWIGVKRIWIELQKLHAKGQWKTNSPTDAAFWDSSKSFNDRVFQKMPELEAQLKALDEQHKELDKERDNLIKDNEFDWFGGENDPNPLLGNAWVKGIEARKQRAKELAHKDFLDQLDALNKVGKDFGAEIKPDEDKETMAHLNTVMGYLDSLKTKLDTLGMSEVDAELYKLRKEHGEFFTFLIEDEARATAKLIEEKERLMNLEKERQALADKIFDAVKTPKERFEEEMKKARELEELGLINKDQLDKYEKGLRRDLFGDTGEIKFGSAMEQDSEAARDAIFRHSELAAPKSKDEDMVASLHSIDRHVANSDRNLKAILERQTTVEVASV